MSSVCHERRLVVRRPVTTTEVLGTGISGMEPGPDGERCSANPGIDAQRFLEPPTSGRMGSTPNIDFDLDYE